MEKIRRTPILINNHAVALLHIFTRYDHLEDLWTVDADGLDKEKWEMYDEAAKQFVEQLEDQWCIKFMEALRDEIDKQIKEHKKEYNMK
jgi:hypothetical protein